MPGEEAAVPERIIEQKAKPRLDSVSSVVPPSGDGAYAPYQEVSMLPSPRLSSDNGLFEAFSGSQIPPLNTISRAPSLHRRDELFNHAPSSATSSRESLGLIGTALAFKSPHEQPGILVSENRIYQKDRTPVEPCLDTINESLHHKGDSGESQAEIDAMLRQPASSDQITLPKRGESRPSYSHTSPAHLLRALSVHLQREARQRAADEAPDADLGRAPSAASLYRRLTKGPVERFADKADVYIAYDNHMRKGAWDRSRFLGKGSFSEVILATPTLSQVKPALRHEACRTVVAVKITRLGKPNTPERRQMQEALRRDIDLVKELCHPSLMSIIALNMDTERALVVLPYCLGGDLFELVLKHRSSLSEPLVRRIFADVTSAISYMHEKHVVHRDIKLENVLIDISIDDLLRLEDPISYPHPIAVVTDLGLAKKIDPNDPLLTTRCGSDDYVPPEIIMGQPYDGRLTDSWALGVLLYTTLEGRLPFDAPPKAQPEGARTRARTAQRICRADWAWYKRRDDSAVWDQAKAVVEACLCRKDTRISVSQLRHTAWVEYGLPLCVEPSHLDDPMQLFIDDSPKPDQVQVLATEIGVL